MTDCKTHSHHRLTTVSPPSHHRHIITAIFWCLTLIHTAPLALADEIDLFVVTGQSNARQNYALGVQATLQSSGLWDRVMVYNSQRSGHWLQSWVSGTNNSYTPASDFTEDLWATDGSSELQQLIEQLEADGHTVTIRGFFWFQGEGDTGSPAHQAEYTDRLTWMFNTLRSHYGNFDLVITLIDWNHDLTESLAAIGRSPEDVEAIRQAQVAASQNLKAATADSRGHHREDVWHIANPNDPLGRYALATNFGSDQAKIMIDRAQCTADINNDGQLDFFDVSAFLQLFAAGCP